MSDVQSQRPAASRGRTSARGGRGGIGRGGPRGTRMQANGDRNSSNPAQDTFIDDQSELGELKKEYSSQLGMLKDMFPDWTDVDLLLALQETNGDLETTIDRVTSGSVAQFEDVAKKTKDRSRSKTPGTGDATSIPPAGTKTGRGRGGTDSIRGGRGRGDRGRAARGGRGGPGATTNGARGSAETSVPTTDVPAWGETPSTDEPKKSESGLKATVAAAKETADKVASKVANKAPTEVKKTWAQMFAAPKPKPAPPKAAPPSKPAAPAETKVAETTPEAIATETAQPPPPIEVPAETSVEEQGLSTPPTGAIGTTSADLTPSKDELTEDNLVQIPDQSQPAPTETAASTIATPRDPRSLAGSATPLTASQAPIGSRPPTGGYAASALKATATPGRSASYQRKIMEQQEAVVMPGNHAVDRAAVQFGSLGLGSGEGLDVDEDREDTETRGQPPQHSPTAQPRASLPPALPKKPNAPQEPQAAKEEGFPSKPPGLSQPTEQTQAQQPAQAAQTAQSEATAHQQGPNQGFNQIGRYGQPSSHGEATASTGKSYDPFGQQSIAQADNYSSQHQGHSGLSGYSSAPNDFSSYYTSGQQRDAYGGLYGGSYGQQVPNQQEAGANQQRAGSGFGSGPGDSGFPSAQAHGNRFGDTQGSGHNTPNPTVGSQHSGPQSQQAQQMHQQPPSHGAGYPYTNPYYNSPYYNAYMQQYGYGQQGYGGGGYNKGGMYGQPHGYGNYDHSSSPANTGAFGNSSYQGRDSALGSSLGGEYSRAGSTPSQAAAQHTSAAGGYAGGMPDSFGRNQNTYSHNQGYGGSHSGAESSLKPFDKAGSGPSQSLSQPGRPGSATQNNPSQENQQQQSAYGSFPGSQGQGQYGGFGGLGHQSQNQGGYNNYSSGFGSSYGSYSNNRGQWGNYGH